LKVSSRGGKMLVHTVHELLWAQSGLLACVRVLELDWQKAESSVTS